MTNISQVLILISNYPRDRQESMERFAQMLCYGFEAERKSVTIWRPEPLFGRFAKSTLNGFGKWLGYIDKWIIFPLILRWRVLNTDKSLENSIRYHICDHSNAPYLGHLPRGRTSITCHDVLAIQGALGDKDAYCPASRTGVILQKWILRHLSASAKLAFVSDNTLKSLEKLSNKQTKGIRKVIPNGFNADFQPKQRNAAWKILDKTGLKQNTPYILHIGSALPRKNRDMLLRMVAKLEENWNGNICFAGQPMDIELKAIANNLGITDRIIEVPKPDHQTLTALYSACEAFVFPSFSEGFGWPLIEAQACGAPVIASNKQPMPEVTGGAAIHADPNDAYEFAQALIHLKEPGVREKLIELGFNNCERFNPELMISKYSELIFDT